jgi:hypothetical protein
MEPSQGVRAWLERHVIWISLGALFAGFVGGCVVGFVVLRITHRDQGIKGGDVRRDQLLGGFSRAAALRELDHLITEGQEINRDESEIQTWLMQVIAFVHGMNLDRDSEWQGQRMAAVEAYIHYAFLDKSIHVQAAKTLGVLKGFRAALSTQMPDQ